jgi:hypothetical protein
MLTLAGRIHLFSIARTHRIVTAGLATRDGGNPRRNYDARGHRRLPGRRGTTAVLAESMSDYLIREIGATPNVQVRYRTEVADAPGADRLESLVLADADSGARRGAGPADALFVRIGSRPWAAWLGKDVVRDQWGFIPTAPDLPADQRWRHATGP